MTTTRLTKVEEAVGEALDTAGLRTKLDEASAARESALAEAAAAKREAEVMYSRAESRLTSVRVHREHEVWGGDSSAAGQHTTHTMFSAPVMCNNDARSQLVWFCVFSPSVCSAVVCDSGWSLCG